MKKMIVGCLLVFSVIFTSAKAMEGDNVVLCKELCRDEVRVLEDLQNLGTIWGCSESEVKLRRFARNIRDRFPCYSEFVTKHVPDDQKFKILDREFTYWEFDELSLQERDVLEVMSNKMLDCGGKMRFIDGLEPYYSKWRRRARVLLQEKSVFSPLIQKVLPDDSKVIAPLGITYRQLDELTYDEQSLINLFIKEDENESHSFPAREKKYWFPLIKLDSMCEFRTRREVKDLMHKLPVLTTLLSRALPQEDARLRIVGEDRYSRKKYDEYPITFGQFDSLSPLEQDALCYIKGLARFRVHFSDSELRKNIRAIIDNYPELPELAPVLLSELVSRA